MQSEELIEDRRIQAKAAQARKPIGTIKTHPDQQNLSGLLKPIRTIGQRMGEIIRKRV